MRCHYCIAVLGLALLISGCGTPEGNAWFTGVSREEAEQVSQVVRTLTPARILSYSRTGDGAINVLTADDQSHTLRRVGGKWRVEHSGPMIL